MILKAKDAYTWQVTYTDGTSTSEYDAVRPDGRGWAEREVKLVQAIALVRVEDGREAASLTIPSDAEPVFFRRRAVTCNPIDESSQSGTLAHCMGWKHDNKAGYLFVFDSGETLFTDDLQAV